MDSQQQLAMLKQQGVGMWNRWRKQHPEIQPNLIGADLSGTILNGVNFHRANLEKANFHKAALSTARLSYANFDGADLSQTNLSHANLGGAYFKGTNLDGANFGHVTLRDAVFAHLNLSAAKGLDTVHHVGPSTVGLDTIHCSKGNIPENFLRGCGVPESFFKYLHSLGDAPFNYFTCFISYASEDEKFVKRLYKDLQQKGVRCWCAPEDIKTGEKFKARIDEAIRQHDKLLLVLSKHSISSEWVQYEVEAALQKEHHKEQLVLFPIRLDSTILNNTTGLVASIKNKRHIGSFEHWKQQDIYQKALHRLLADLKVVK